jgi:hypothetical protein
MACLSAAAANLTPAFAAVVAEVAVAERRRSRLEVDAAVVRARAEVEDAKLAVLDERETTEAVRAEVAEQEAVMTAKDQEIERLTRPLAERDGVLAGLRTEAAVARQAADGKRQRADRAEAEADRLRQERADRDAIARAGRRKARLRHFGRSSPLRQKAAGDGNLGYRKQTPPQRATLTNRQA